MTQEEYWTQSIDKLMTIHNDLVGITEALEDLRFASAMILAVCVFHFAYTVFKSRLVS